MTNSRYIHDFTSCSRTYATLCIYHDSMDTNEVTKILKLKPDHVTKIGDYLRKDKSIKIAGWFLGTQDILDSRDMRAHVEWLLAKLNRKKKAMQILSKMGFTTRISIFWESSSGNGGPIIDNELAVKLAKYDIDLYFDIYFE